MIMQFFFIIDNTVFLAHVLVPDHIADLADALDFSLAVFKSVRVPGRTGLLRVSKRQGSEW